MTRAKEATTTPSAEPPEPTCLTLTVAEAAKVIGISRNHAYEQVALGIIPSRRIGRRFVISRQCLERWIDGREP